MGVKIKRRQYRSWLESAINEGRFLPESEDFFRKVLLNSDVWLKSDGEPVKITAPWRMSTWLYKDTQFDVSNCSGFADEDIMLLIRDALDRERKKIEKLKSRYGNGNLGQYRRVVIPDDVRMFVWQRDGGACVKCLSNHNLEYDHIIPVSKGGSSTARNLQLLCEECNRRKSDCI